MKLSIRRAVLGFSLLVSVAQAQLQVADTTFSRDRGFYEESIELTVSSATPGATIAYTLDGSDPRDSKSAVSGVSPLTVRIDPENEEGKWKATPAVIVRAYAHKEGLEPTNVDTHTYIFTDKVVHQGDIRPGGSHVFWNSTEMDPEVIEDAAYADEVDDGLLAIPTWSIVMDHEDLFGEEGIHRGDNLRRKREKPCSIELIYPATPAFEGFEGFQVDCGIKNQGGGGLWRNGTYDHKQSFGIRFRREYGTGNLKYPLFEHAALNSDSECGDYDKLILRAGHNKSYGATWDASKTTYVRDQVARDLQIDMSGIGGHGSFVHLYLNGIYWGLYNPCERQDSAFAASYLGGNKEDYHTGRGRGGDSSGDDDRYDHWRNTVSESSDVNTLLQYCNIDNHADLSIFSAYADIGDFPQYYYNIRNNPGGQVYLFNWDVEDAFGGGSKRSSDNPESSLMNKVAGFRDMWSNNLEYRVNFADRVYRLCFNKGALTDARVLERWNRLCDSIYSAMVCESARWGDERGSSPRTRDRDWARARAAVASSTKGKAARLIKELRGDRKYPAINPPLFKDGGTTIAVTRKVVPSGFKLTLQRDGSDGTIYYTTDGSAPRAVGGEPQGTSVEDARVTISIDSTTCVKARTLDDDTWSALHESVLFVNQDMSALKISEIMYHPQDAVMASDRPISSITGNAASIDPGFAGRALITFSSALPDALTGGDKVRISGAANPSNNGTFTIAKVVFEGSIGQTRTRKVLLTEELIDANGDGVTGDFFYDGDRYEFIELKNTGSSTLNLSGVTFLRGVDCTFPDGSTLAPGGYAIVARNPWDFAERYPGVELVGSFPASSLENGGERVELALGTGIRHDVSSTTTTADGRGAITFSKAPAGVGKGDRVRISLASNYSSNKTFTIQTVAGNVVYVDEPLATEAAGPKAFLFDVITSVEYNDRDPWPLPADGYGYSLVHTTRADQDEPDAWRLSATLNGSPGAELVAGEKPSAVKVNEILAHTDQPQRDAIELYNPTGKPVDIGGWYLTDDPKEPQKWVIPADTVIPANGYKVFYEGHYEGANLQFASAEFGSAFALSSTGDDAYLFSPNLAYSHGFRFEGSPNGVSFGLHQTTEGDEYFTAQKSFTPGAVNSAPAVGPVVITEIMYHPETDHEFLELANISASPVLLYDPANPTHTWKVGGIGFQFPPDNVTLNVGEVILLVRDTITPADFRTTYGVPGNVQAFSYDGKLDNGGEKITLRRPDQPVATGSNAGEVPYIVVDQVKYDDKAPWPKEPDGTGPSLERITSESYGNEVTSWQTSSGSGGTPGVGGKAPTAPFIAVSRSNIRVTVDLGESAPEETFRVWNSGVDRLDYLLKESSEWFSLTDANGSSGDTGEKVTHTVTLATSGLGVGLHRSAITIADNGSSALNGPVSIDVSVLVNPPPAPEIAMDTEILEALVSEGGTAVADTFKVWNSGTGILNYNGSSDVAWMSISPTSSSSANAVSKQPHAVTYDTKDLVPGSYSGTITVADPNVTNGDQAIRVRLTVREPSIFTAYNDFSWASGQLAENITGFTTDHGSGSPPNGRSGLLIDHATGEETGVTLNVTGGDWNGRGHVTQGAEPDPGTEAHKVFSGILSSEGVISYGGDDIVLKLTGLDKDRRYTAVLFSNRDDHDDRQSTYTISDVASFKNESTVGAVRSKMKRPEDSVTINTDNTANGYVVRYTDIAPGDDGDMQITISGNRVYLSAMMLDATSRKK